MTLPGGKRWRERAAWAIGALVLAVVSGLVVRLSTRPDPVLRQRARWVITPPDKLAFHATGDAGGPVVVSPDGQRLAFAAVDTSGNQQLWIRPLDALEAQPLAGTEGAYYPFWSPDSRALGFFSNGQLKRVNAEGGPVMSLCGVVNARGGAWNQQGVIGFAPNYKGGLYRVLAAGGNPTPVTQVDFSKHDSHRWPHFLPDGEHLLYLAISHADVSHSREGVYVASLVGKESKFLLATRATAAYADGNLLYLNESTLMAQPLDPRRLELSGEPRIVEEGVETNLGWNLGVFSASQNGVLAFAPAAPNSGNQIMWMSDAGKRLEVVGDVGHYQSLRLSPDGQQLAVEHERPSHHLWVYDLKRESRSQFTFGSSADTVPVWSPDGKEILFASDHNSHADLYRKTVGGSEGERLLLESVNNKFPLDWSPDGQALLYAETDQSYKSSLWVLPMSGSGKTHLLLPDDFYAEDGFFSPDGHWIAYTSREQGTNQVFVIPYPGPGAKKQISSTGGSSPVWRKDGRAVFFIDDSNNIQQTEIDIKNSGLMVGSTRTLFHGNMEILPDQGRTYDVASDGRFIGNIRKQENQTQIVVVSNWSTALRK